MSKVLKLDEKYRLVELRTGNMINEKPTDVIKSIKKEDNRNKIMRLKYNFENDPNNLTTEEIEEALRINNMNVNSLKQYNDFILYYTGNKEKLLYTINVLSDQAFKCFYKLVAKYTSCENTIQFTGNSVNIVKDEKFSEVLEISTSKWSRVKKELVDNHCIRRITFNGNVLYKINPTIIGHSMKITKATYYAFRNQLIEDFEPYKVVYWDKQISEEFGQAVLDECIDNS